MNHHPLLLKMPTFKLGGPKTWKFKRQEVTSFTSDAVYLFVTGRPMSKLGPLGKGERMKEEIKNCSFSVSFPSQARKIQFSCIRCLGKKVCSS